MRRVALRLARLLAVARRLHSQRRIAAQRLDVTFGNDDDEGDEEAGEPSPSQSAPLRPLGTVPQANSSTHAAG